MSRKRFFGPKINFGEKGDNASMMDKWYNGMLRGATGKQGGRKV